MFVQGCPLCEARKLTTWYREEKDFWIADCDTCHVPMAVAHRHEKVTKGGLLNRMIEALHEVAQEKFGRNYYIDTSMRKIYDHFHMHARPIALEGTEERHV